MASEEQLRTCAQRKLDLEEVRRMGEMLKGATAAEDMFGKLQGMRVLMENVPEHDARFPQLHMVLRESVREWEPEELEMTKQLLAGEFGKVDAKVGAELTAALVAAGKVKESTVRVWCSTLRLERAERAEAAVQETAQKAMETEPEEADEFPEALEHRQRRQNLEKEAVAAHQNVSAMKRVLDKAKALEAMSVDAGEGLGRDKMLFGGRGVESSPAMGGVTPSRSRSPRRSGLEGDEIVTGAGKGNGDVGEGGALLASSGANDDAIVSIPDLVAGMRQNVPTVGKVIYAGDKAWSMHFKSGPTKMYSLTLAHAAQNLNGVAWRDVADAMASVMPSFREQVVRFTRVSFKHRLDKRLNKWVDEFEVLPGCNVYVHETTMPTLVNAIIVCEPLEDLEAAPHKSTHAIEGTVMDRTDMAPSPKGRTRSVMTLCGTGQPAPVTSVTAWGAMAQNAGWTRGNLVRISRVSLDQEFKGLAVSDGAVVEVIRTGCLIPQSLRSLHFCGLGVA